MLARWLVAAVVLTSVLWIATPSLADEGPAASDLELARTYAPVFYFHPEEIFRPQPVSVILEQARLRRSRRFWPDSDILLSVASLDLARLESDRSHFLDVWYGDEGGSAYTNYSAHRAFYRGALSPDVGGPPATVYAHLARDGLGRLTIQYWALYFYNDWFNKHEGDWEMVQVMFGTGGDPEWVVLSQHHGGTRRSWAHAPVEEGTHPAAYVALGSHANYFVGDETYPNTQEIGDRRITILDRTGVAARLVPEVLVVPDRDQLAGSPSEWPQAAWLGFRGRWGEVAAQGDFSGPLGPADKGEQWEQPYAWGLAQPLDTETWYDHRLRVEVLGSVPDDHLVRLVGPLDALSSAVSTGNLAILHGDPPGEMVTATIDVPPETTADVVATWPDRRAAQVTHFRFADVAFSGTGLAKLQLAGDDGANLFVDCEPSPLAAPPACGESLTPQEVTTVEATWDAHDVVWVGDVLAAERVGAGLLLAVLGSVVPTVLYVGALYWLDRHEKEPALLLAAALLWGSIPALFLALAAEILFRLPPDLLGPSALGAAQLGLVAPLLQETVKGVAVLFIALRYWREFDDPLDGAIYGAVVGFGFAMTGSLIDRVGSFALWGFEGFSVGTFVEGPLFALRHAAYTALFGISLSLARVVRQRWQRWAVPSAGLALAVMAHVLNNLSTWSLLGVDAVAVLTSAAGLMLIAAVAVWSFRRQQRSLRSQLQDELPDALYRTLLTPQGRASAAWQAFRTGGLGSWRRTRRLHERSMALAARKREQRDHPNEPRLALEIDRLRGLIDTLVE